MVCGCVSEGWACGVVSMSEWGVSGFCESAVCVCECKWDVVCV